jgi:tRNA pseudouridine38-40 synthase|tara:strand:- start:1182 stop:1961 length:780 start_codon:yes stop_codon:yes gene_type:complete
MRIALGLEYDGADFCGWQSQSSGCGVQDALETAIASIAQHSVRVHAAGRTDAGVHALMQVVHFDTKSDRDEYAWVRGVNAFLPPSVRVVWSKRVTDEFHARFSAQLRHYEYMLINASVSPAILATKAGWYHLPLSLVAMQKGASYLIGEHDFSAFRASECQAKTPIRTMHEVLVRQAMGQFIFKFSANAFLQHQVRNMLGALIYVGNGKYPPELVKELLAQKDRTLSPPTFSPNGLYLTGVDYDEQWQLPSGAKNIGLI